MRLSIRRPRSVTLSPLRFQHVTLSLPLGLTLLLLALYAFVPEGLTQLSFVPLFIGMVFLGLPHGALDHLLPARLGFAWGRQALPLTLYLFAYLALVVLMLGLWLWQPQGAFVFFLVMTVLHWGHAELRYWQAFMGRHPQGFWRDTNTLLLRGSLPILVPLAAYPETAASLYAHASAGLGLQSPPLLLSPLYPTLALLLLALPYLTALPRAAASREGLWLELLEVTLLTVFFVLLPAYLTVGLYFLLFHSLRHMARLLLLNPLERRALRQGAWSGPLYRLWRDTLPLTVVALGFLAGLYYLSTGIRSSEGFVALYLVLISALTLPHVGATLLIDMKSTHYP